MCGYMFIFTDPMELAGAEMIAADQSVSPDQDIWNQQWSVEQAAEEFIYFDAYRGDFMQNSGLPRGGCDGDRVR